jgi:hypothetical protein
MSPEFDSPALSAATAIARQLAAARSYQYEDRKIK